MSDYLAFLLSGPMASFGGYAGHERRGSELMPLRSAVLGLIGAALGLYRTDSEGQTALRAYSVAVQSRRRTVPIRDYHTAQTVPTAKAKRPMTRKHALDKAGKDANTIITIRDYHCDVVIGGVLWGKGRWSLEEVAESMRRPKFPMYLGRKSCPLASPLNPCVVKAESPVDALASIEIPEWLGTTPLLDQDYAQPIYSDPVEGISRPLSIQRVPGEPLDRHTWTFGDCDVWHLSNKCAENDATGNES